MPKQTRSIFVLLLISLGAFASLLPSVANAVWQATKISTTWYAHGDWLSNQGPFGSVDAVESAGIAWCLLQPDYANPAVDCQLRAPTWISEYMDDDGVDEWWEFYTVTIEIYYDNGHHGQLEARWYP